MAITSPAAPLMATATCRAVTPCPAASSSTSKRPNSCVGCMAGSPMSKQPFAKSSNASMPAPTCRAPAAPPGRRPRCITCWPTRSTPEPPTPIAIRLCPGNKAAQPPRPAQQPGPALPQAARTVDRHSRAGAGRSKHLGPGTGATRAQRSTLVPQQHPAQLPAALPAHLRGLRAGHVWHHPPRVGSDARAANLRVPRQGLHPECAGHRLPQPQCTAPKRSSRSYGTTSRACLPTPTSFWRSSTALPPPPPAPPGSKPPSSSCAPGWTGPHAPISDCWTPTRPAPSACPSCPNAASTSRKSARHWSSSKGNKRTYASSSSRLRRCGPTWQTFCERIRGRLAEATLAEKQAILQLVVERIIVGDGSLEIRHVIPLAFPTSGQQWPHAAQSHAIAYGWCEPCSVARAPRATAPLAPVPARPRRR